MLVKIYCIRNHDFLQRLSDLYQLMSANVFGAKKFIPTAPDKGSFPLDHEGELCTKQFQNLVMKMCLLKYVIHLLYLRYAKVANF